MKPDLVIGFRGNSLQMLKRMQNLHLPLFALEVEESLESLFDIINKIGKITQENDKAQNLVQSLRKRYKTTQSILINVQHEPKVFLWLYDQQGFWTCGRKNFLDTLIKEAKGVNIAGDTSRRWLLFNREQLIHKNPEIIIVLSESRKIFPEAKERLKNNSLFKHIKAVETDKIYFLDEDLATRPGPRLIDALAKLAHFLHPQYFSSIQ